MLLAVKMAEEHIGLRLQNLRAVKKHAKKALMLSHAYQHDRLNRITKSISFRQKTVM